MSVAVSLMGPTAAGKSDLALELARRLPFEIISVDSAQVYRGMDIGTSKPDQHIRDEIPHHLIDIRDPANRYSAAEFRQDALKVMEQISRRGRIPLLVGGTMLYFKALKEGLAGMPSANPRVRQKILDMASEQGWPAVHARLATVDPAAAARIHPNDPQRLQRALEIYEVTGQPMSEMHTGEHEPLPYRLCELAIMPEDRAELHRRISERFAAMIDAGFIDEVRRLHDRGDLDEELPAIRAVGYRQAWQFLENRITSQTMIEKAVVATRRLAKHQMTWLRSWNNVKKIDEPHIEQALKVLESTSILENNQLWPGICRPAPGFPGQEKGE